MTSAGFEHLPGTELPGRTVEIGTEEDARFRAAVAAPDGDGDTVHPLWAFVASVRGVELPIAAVLALADFDLGEEGALLAACDFEFARPLRSGRAYRVSGRIESIERKRGRRTGAFDLLRIRYSIADDEGEAASFLNTTVLPRSES